MLKNIFWFKGFFLLLSFYFVLFSFEYSTYLQSLKFKSTSPVSNGYGFFSNGAMALASVVCRNSMMLLIHFLCLKEKIGV